jgi:hypothetical protein
MSEFVHVDVGRVRRWVVSDQRGNKLARLWSSRCRRPIPMPRIDSACKEHPIKGSERHDWVSECCVSLVRRQRRIEIRSEAPHAVDVRKEADLTTLQHDRCAGNNQHGVGL